MDAIKKSDSFKEYKKYLIEKEPTILNPVTDENNNHIGYIAQFEIDFEKDSKQKKDLLTFNSLLTYIIDFSEDEMLEGLLDYSNVVSEKKIYFNNFGTGETVTYDVSDIPELQEVVVMLNRKLML
ncbi:hypothetical protein [Bacillus canaveralius]|uniref:hypothetical protein n=1 Tax=Bacillus canaveralius TaxID=1403243 RepID=UPI000F79CB89|nr:hypothetical protein [Bacillus canaveralius]RSK47922.1 hypothetical protein EJA13_17765 [Bacillus canaveralius]